jgi:hypothetical protein
VLIDETLLRFDNIWAAAGINNADRRQSMESTGESGSDLLRPQARPARSPGLTKTPWRSIGSRKATLIQK